MQTSMIVVIVVSGLIWAAIIAIIGGFLQVRRERLLDHQVRMKALELGQPLPETQAVIQARAAVKTAEASRKAEAESLPRTCFTTALWVAFWGFLGASGQGSFTHNPGIAVAIAAATGAIGVTFVICGTVLAMRTSESSSSFNGYSDYNHKPIMEPEAFDVVSSRG